MALSAPGIGSGLDIAAIVNALVDAEKVPKEAIFDKTEQTIKAQVSAMGTLKSSLSSFQDALKNLQDVDLINHRTVTTGDSPFFTASTTKSAQNGSYSIQVEQLAKVHKVGGAYTTDAQQTVGEGRLDFTVGSESFGVDIEATDDLNSIANKINNANDNSGVTATVITGDNGSRLVFSSDIEGTDSQVSVAATDTSGTGLNDMFNGTNLAELQPAQNSIVHIDGQQVTSQTNSVQGAITGVTLDLTKADLNETSTLTIAQDSAAVKETVQGFVDAYNSLITTVDNLSKYDTENETASVLQGDAMLRSINSQFRNVLSDRVELEDGSDTALYELGITTDRYGKLSIDDDKLDDIIANDMDKLEAIFATETTGLANKFDDLVDNYTKTGGLIDDRNNSYTKSEKRLDEQRDAFTLKMEQLEARLTKQFNAMDLVVAQLNAQSASLTDRLNSLPGLVPNS
ncbi:flagellar filament capping protein FliD [Shewanella maritima]|uniref:flagellar filament capping protein FliD n=1 Tax=Shewanella maritima TaxID=2520507 RepID=UPI003735F4E0